MKKHEVTILTNQGKIDLECTKLIQIKSWRFPTPKYAFMPGLIKFVNSGKLNDYDIIHIFEYPIFVADFLTLNKKKIKPPLILSFHASLHQQTKFPLNIFKKIHHFIMLKYSWRISTFIASTVAEKSHVLKYGIEDSKVQILPLGVNYTPVDRTNISRKRILYVGLLGITKNIDLLIKAFSLCDNKELELILAGPDYGMLKNLKMLVKKLKIEKRVSFRGRVSEEEKTQLFSNATIFVHPSIQDIFSLTLIEAAAAGIPSIAFDVEANSEILDHMNTGMIAKKLTPESLKETIELLLKNKDLYEKISNNAKKLIPQKYNWDNTVNCLEEYYHNTILKNN